MQLRTLGIVAAAAASIYLILPYIPPGRPFFTMSEANGLYEEIFFSRKNNSENDEKLAEKGELTKF